MNTYQVYLCGPINGCHDSQCKDWREYAASKLQHTLDPMRRDYRGQEQDHAAEIVQNDIQDIKNSSVLLANLSYQSATSFPIGSPMEILLAHQHHLMVVAVVNDPDHASPWLSYHCDEIHGTLDDAIESLTSWYDHADQDPVSMGWIGDGGLP